MKRLTIAILLILLTGLPAGLLAQATGSDYDVQYRRSSLHTILVESENFPMKDTVIRAYYQAPFPDKYNNHTVGEKSFDPARYGYTLQEMNEHDEAKDEAMQHAISRYLKENEIARQMIARWFNRKEDGSFDVSLIQERGFYDADAMQVSIAKGSARGVAALGDAGQELINNTFVVATKLNFVDNEIAATIIYEAAMAAAGEIGNPIARELAEKAAKVAYEKGKEGYSVWTTAYLYQLKWNDSIEAVFYEEMWMDSTSIDPERRAAFDNTDIFELEYVGDAKASSLVTFSLRKGEFNRSEEEIVTLSTVRNIDKVYVALQKEYDVFKTKTPIISTDPIAAKIGMKEGLEKNDKYEVLEQVLDLETGKTKYERVGVVKVDGDHIWDNRYNLGDGPMEVADASQIGQQDEENKSKKNKKDEKNNFTETWFKGAKKYHVGMLLRQVKK